MQYKIFNNFILQTYHKSCFKCTSCGKGLDSTTLTHKDDDVFCRCKSHV